jgi:alpha-N-arabinofuranosidase
VIAPMMTEPGGASWKQTIFHPFALTSQRAVGEVLQVAVDAPTMTTQRFGDVAAVDATVTYDAVTGDLVLFAVNRSLDEPVVIDVPLRAFDELDLVEALTYANDDYLWQATAADSTSVLPEANATAVVADGRLTAELPPVSWSMVRLGRA